MKDYDENIQFTLEEMEALAASRVAELRERERVLSEEKEAEIKKEEKSKKTRKRLRITAVILFILLLIWGFYTTSLPIPERVQEIIDIIKEDTIDIDEVEKAEEIIYDPRYASLTISMNKIPVFTDGLAQGKVNILNDELNVYSQYVEIYLLDKEGNCTDKILTTGLIEVGQILEYDTLDVNLPAGVYECIAYFNAVDPDTKAYAGKAAAKITITVENTIEE